MEYRVRVSPRFLFLSNSIVSLLKKYIQNHQFYCVYHIYQCHGPRVTSGPQEGFPWPLG